ncbi:MAG: SDR family NAD(P)-dependent oxidoreductase [Clostridia bacterium]|nr:SDR family NAD(P)-dependent oxidoreductase [Clostridia bacterium]
MNKYFNKHTTVLITGASSGIGKELSTLLIKEYGATVFGSGRNIEKLNLVKEALGESFICLPFDAGSLSEWERVYNYFYENGLKLNCVINCAGVLPAFSKFNKNYYEENKSVLEINLNSVIYSASTMLPLLNESENPIMINVSSSSALCPFAGVSLYTATKSAVTAFSESLSCENDKVKVVTVMPGFTKTNVMRSQTATEKEMGLIDKISNNAEKVAKIIIKKSPKKRRIIIGADAHFMNFLYKFFPSSAPRFLTWFIKKTKMKIFEKI